jgi:glycosyltransferase involved in cell wall biosynthesis
VGDGPLRSALQAAAIQLGAPVTFLGTRPQADLPALLNQAAVFVLPSHYEGNPKALVEAMACGIPVVGARSPGIREIVKHKETGVLCGTSVGEIRAALVDVANDASLCERIGAGGMAFVRAHCSVESAVARELALYGSLG